MIPTLKKLFNRGAPRGVPIFLLLTLVCVLSLARARPVDAATCWEDSDDYYQAFSYDDIADGKKSVFYNYFTDRKKFRASGLRFEDFGWDFNWNDPTIYYEESILNDEQILGPRGGILTHDNQGRPRYLGAVVSAYISVVSIDKYIDNYEYSGDINNLGISGIGEQVSDECKKSLIKMFLNNVLLKHLDTVQYRRYIIIQRNIVERAIIYTRNAYKREKLKVDALSQAVRFIVYFVFTPNDKKNIEMGLE